MIREWKNILPCKLVISLHVNCKCGICAHSFANIHKKGLKICLQDGLAIIRVMN